jgi:putative two-component system response regulator
MEKDILKNGKILMVDDQESNINLVFSILRDRGFLSLHSITDSRRVLAMFTELQPDLVLLDLRMPNVDGLSLLKQLRSRIAGSEYLPFLIITGDLSERTRQNALSLGAKDFLTKPINPPEAVLRMYNLLETRFMYLAIQERNRILDETVKQRTRELEAAQAAILRHLALAADYRDDLTGLHAQRVGLLASMIARAVNCSEDEIKLIRNAAPLHDLGKIGVPDQILLKEGALTPAEFEVIKNHVHVGGRILSGSNYPLLKMAEEIARYHHEHWDGGGYQSIKGSEIPLAARITAVADAFDIITHTRPYKSASGLEETLAEMQSQKGRQFDPELIDALLKLISGNGLFDLNQALHDEATAPVELAPVQ